MNLIIKLILVIREIINFPTAILDRLGLLKGEVKYNLRNGSEFLARAGTEDLSEIAVVASGSEYKLDKLKLPKSPVIIDLGGYIGDFSIPTARSLKSKCKIYSFEPNLENYDLMIRNIKLNKIKNIVPSRVAISDFNGSGYLKTEKLNTDAYYLLENVKKNNCRVRTLPSEFKKLKIKKVDLLKMDIEGEEEKIFKHKASLDLIKKTVHYIFIEIGPKYESSQMKKILDKNFNTLFVHNNVLALENPRWSKE